MKDYEIDNLMDYIKDLEIVLSANGIEFPPKREDVKATMDEYFKGQ